MIPIVGRTRELDAGRSFLDDLTQGRGRACLVWGEAGIGKTRLIDELVAEAGSRGLSVLRASSQELERDRPFGLLADALRGWGLTLDRPGPPSNAGLERATEPSVNVRYRIVDTIEDVVEDRSLTAPVLLALEDLHWGDASSLIAIHRLVRRTAQLALGLCLTARPTPRPPELDRVAQALSDGGGSSTTLEPLSEEAVRRLVEALVGNVPGPNLVAQAAGASGNPLFVTELVGALEREGAIRRSEGTADVQVVSPSPSLRVAIVRRLGFLSEATLDLLRTASVLGSEFEVTDLCAVLARPASELLPLLAEARDARVLAEAADRLTFRHELVRDAVYEDVPLAARRALHLQAGRALAGAGAPAVRAATQMALGAERGDEEAIGWLRRAAAHAFSHDPSASSDLLQRALDLMDEHHPDRDATTYTFALSLMGASRPLDAERVLDDGIARGARGFKALFRYLRSLVLGGLGRAQQGLEATDALSSDPSDLHEGWTTVSGQDMTAKTLAQTRAILLASRSALRGGAGDTNGALADAKEALSLAEGIGYEPPLREALFTLALDAYIRSSLDEAVELAERAIADSPRPATDAAPPEIAVFIEHAFEVQQLPGFVPMALALLAADRLNEAEDALRRLQDRANHFGVGLLAPLSHYHHATQRTAAGRWDDALADLEAGLAAAEELGELGGRTGASAQLVWLGVHRDDEKLIERGLELLDRDASSTSVSAFDLYAAVRGRGATLAESRGDHDLARTLLEALWAGARSNEFFVGYRELGPDYVRLKIAAGHHDEARAAALLVEEAARRAPAAPSAQGVAQRCRGLVHDDPDILLEAVEAYRRSPRPVELAWACEDAGVALVNDGRATEGVPLLQEALSAFEAVGALRDVRRVEAYLRSAGVRRGRRGTRRRPATGWDALTDTEGRVVELVGEGLTNRQVGERLYISRRTVDTHLAHVFQKIGVRSRAELIAQAVRRRG